MTHTPGDRFTSDDAVEVLDAIQNQPGVMYRPGKVRKMLAYKACREAVMFGTDLNPEKMRSIVVNMGTMDQPWNCPHGRPTIRHVGTMRCSRIASTFPKKEEEDG